VGMLANVLPRRQLLAPVGMDVSAAHLDREWLVALAEMVADVLPKLAPVGRDANVLLGRG